MFRALDILVKLNIIIGVVLISILLYINRYDEYNITLAVAPFFVYIYGLFWGFFYFKYFHKKELKELKDFNKREKKFYKIVVKSAKIDEEKNKAIKFLVDDIQMMKKALDTKHKYFPFSREILRTNKSEFIIHTDKLAKYVHDTGREVIKDLPDLLIEWDKLDEDIRGFDHYRAMTNSHSLHFIKGPFFENMWNRRDILLKVNDRTIIPFIDEIVAVINKEYRRIENE